MLCLCCLWEHFLFRISQHKRLISLSFILHLPSLIQQPLFCHSFFHLPVKWVMFFVFTQISYVIPLLRIKKRFNYDCRCELELCVFLVSFFFFCFILPQYFMFFSFKKSLVVWSSGNFYMHWSLFLFHSAWSFFFFFFVRLLFGVGRRFCKTVRHICVFVGKRGYLPTFLCFLIQCLYFLFKGLW